MTMKAATSTRTGKFRGTREMLRSAIAPKPSKSTGLSGTLKKVNDIVRPCLITVTQLVAVAMVLAGSFFWWHRPQVSHGG